MKKTMVFFAAALCLAAVSCNKIDSPAPASDEIQFNFSIAPLGPGTKAAKTGWADGDRLNIWIDINGVDQTDPDLVLTYNGATASWEAGALRSGVQANLKADGKITAVFEGYNDFSKYKSITAVPKEPGSNAYIKFEPDRDGGWVKMPGSLAYSFPLLVYSEQQDYSYDGTTLTATFGNWEFKSKFKVLVKNDNGNMTGSASNYYLNVVDAADNRATGLGIWYLHFYETGESSGINASSGNTYGYVRGVQEADGIAFYFSDFATTAKDVTFTMFIPPYTEKTYTATNKTIVANDNTKCVGVALNYSSFADVPEP
ncbi:MAG: hypothetical protein IJM00_05185 [Bacteroidales bacterium]|nr:hypothetical protein [Bacteroidales bacterium]